MKRILVIWFLFASSHVILAQDLFNLGLKYFEKGQYSLADSIFSICVKDSKLDLNLMFNYATTRLYLRDTSKFCDIMWNLGHLYQDKEATNLFFKNCGSVDTTYYDKNFIKCDRKNARYTEVVESFKYKEYKIGFLHDKRSKGKTVIRNADFMNLQSTDIISQYHLLKDGSKLFVFTTTPPKYIDGFDASRDYIASNPYTKEAKEKLHVSKLVVSVKYIIDKIGNINNIEITDINMPVENKDLLKKYIDLIVSGLPKQTPGKFRDENVDFLVEDSISIW
jgi:hypothetical protein